jgi:hypothetical protein
MATFHQLYKKIIISKTQKANHFFWMAENFHPFLDDFLDNSSL